MSPRGAPAIASPLRAASSRVTLPHTRTTSISWRINAERIVLLGWGRAILLQLAHPLVAAGVFEHSGFRATPLAAASRLYHTVHAMLSLTFGTEPEQQRTLDAIRAIHRRVNGTLGEATGSFPAGTPYSAEDPALVLWVHVTLLESIVLAYEQLVGPLSAEERDAYCAEAAPIAIALNARASEVPQTYADARTHLAAMYSSGTLAAGRQGRELAHAVLSPSAGWIAGPATWANRIVTTGLLPAHVRDLYGLSWTPRQQRAFTRLVPALRRIRHTLPDRLAIWPQARR